MTDEIIAVETAILAQQKGFNDMGCGRFFIWDTDKQYHTKLSEYDVLIPTSLGNPLAPTQSYLQTWLRDKHKLHVEITAENFTDGFNWNVRIIDLIPDEESMKVDFKLFGKRTSGLWGDNSEFGNYEQALEFGLFEALKLI